MNARPTDVQQALSADERAELEAYRERKRKRQERCREISVTGRETQMARSEGFRNSWLRFAKKIKEDRPYLLEDDVAIQVREQCRALEMWKSKRKRTPHSISEILRHLRKHRRTWHPKYTEPRGT